MDYLKLEQAMYDALAKEFKPDEAQAYWGRYLAAKNKLFTEILPWIRANEPNLTDHGEPHITNVLNNAYRLIQTDIDKLLNKDESISKNAVLTALDLYVLCQAILFHDVGNFFGRQFHNQQIQKILNHSFSDFFDGKYKRERKLIVDAGRAHTGKNREGSKDTLGEVGETEHLDGNPVKLRDIASIVRLADELAEGPQRTSQVMLDMEMFDVNSEIFHYYASCTHVLIDPPNKRISLNYQIEISEAEDGKINTANGQELSEFLDYIYKRIMKLDEERKYCGYYCNLLAPVKKTLVTFDFFQDSCVLNFKVDQLILNDLEIPGEGNRSLVELRPDLEEKKLVADLDAFLKQKEDHQE